jgi:hypothetical protein
MPVSQSKGRTGRQRKFLSKSSLLPMDSASARQLGLTHHLALAACRDNGGNKHLINELTRAVYLTYFLQQMGFGALPFDAYRKAETAISTALKNAERGGDWRIASRDASSLEEILALHDEQLANAPLYRVVEAERRLRAFIMGSQPSPLKKTDEFRSL